MRGERREFSAGKDRKGERALRLGRNFSTQGEGVQGDALSCPPLKSIALNIGVQHRVQERYGCLSDVSQREDAQRERGG